MNETINDTIPAGKKVTVESMSLGQITVVSTGNGEFYYVTALPERVFINPSKCSWNSKPENSKPHSKKR